LRHDGTATHKRLWSGAKTGKASVVPLSQQVVKVLRHHRKTMQCLGLNTKDGLVFVTPRTHGHLFDLGVRESLEAFEAAGGTDCKASVCPKALVSESFPGA
jgi:ribosomal protein L30/L7E